MLILPYSGYNNYALNFQTFFIINQSDVSGKSQKQKSNMHAGGCTNSNPIQSILVYFMCKHRNPIQNALKLFKGTISKQCQKMRSTALQKLYLGPVFRLSVCKHSRAHSRAFFVPDS